MLDACALPRNYLGRMHVLMLFFMLAVGASGALSIDSPGEAMQDDDDSVWCWLFLAAAISCGCRVSLLARNVSSRGRLSSDPQRYCAWCSGQTFIKIRLGHLRSIPFICCRLESRETRRRKRLLRSWKIAAAVCTAEQDANAAAFARSGVHHLNVRVVVDWHRHHTGRPAAASPCVSCRLCTLCTAAHVYALSHFCSVACERRGGGKRTLSEASPSRSRVG